MNKEDNKMLPNQNINRIPTIMEESCKILRVAVCDDEPEQLERIKQIMDEVKLPVLVQAEYFATAQLLLEELRMRQEKCRVLPDVIFCDIKMPGMDGITFGKKVRDISPAIYLVLFTAYAEYAIQGYETRAFRFLLKPFTAMDVTRVLGTILVEKGRRKKLLIRTSEKECLLELSDITYLSSEDKYTILYTKDGYYVDRTSLKDYEAMLEAYGFCRIHRKYLVNLSEHRGIGRGKVTLQDGTELPISRRRENVYHAKLLQLLGEELLP